MWQDSWPFSDLVGTPMGPIPEPELNLKVSDLFTDHSREWDALEIEKHFPLPSETIRSIKPSKWGGTDKRIWLKHSSGNYSAKSGYYIALEKINKTP